MKLLTHLQNIYRLGLKELISLRYDVVMVVLIVYFFSYAVIAPAKSTQMNLTNASVAVVDEDGSTLSQRIHDALLPPYFLPPSLHHFSTAGRILCSPSLLWFPAPTITMRLPRFSLRACDTASSRR